MNLHAELMELVHLFSAPGALVEHVEPVPETNIPPLYHELLAHQLHMTLMAEQYHHTPVTVQILATRNTANIYCRQILLRRADNGQPVQLGVVRFNLAAVSVEVQEEIVAGHIPLGKVLIHHDVPRRIQVEALLKVTAGPELAERFRIPLGSTTYGRLATISCNHQPAVDLLEILPPLPFPCSSTGQSNP